MTSEEKMREALEEIKDLAETFHCELGENWRDIKSIAESALHSVEAEKDPEWLRLEMVGPELGEDVDIKLLDGSILIECQPQSDGDFYCNSIFGEFFVCSSNVIQWKPTGLRKPAPPEHKPE